MAAHYQLFPALEPATEAALRSSLKRRGVLVAITVDQHGNILDGHHRHRLAAELGIDCPSTTHTVDSDEDANDIARTLNLDRRHLTPEDRQAMAAEMRSEGHSFRAIAGALGVDDRTVRRDLSTEAHAAVGPDRITGLDGKSRPARRPQPAPVEEDEGNELGFDLDEKPWKLAHATATGDTASMEAASRQAAKRAPMAVPKPAAGPGIPPHPATYPQAILDIFREAIPAGSKVLDPFAGVGTIHQLRPDIETYGIELEAEWAEADPRTTVGNSRNAQQIFAGQQFDVIATSPAYGNRLADFYDAYDPEARRSYAIDLGHALTEDNGGGLHYDTDGRYEELHEAVWASVVQLLRPGGVFLLNCKDFQRSGRIKRPTGWHLNTLAGLGLRTFDLWTLPAAGLPFTNAKPLSELVVALEKP